MKNRLKGQCIRPKSKRIELGEKPTKYFINLETRNYVSKQIPNIENDYDSVILIKWKFYMKQNVFMKSFI